MDIYILGIESSCDETSFSIVKNGVQEISTVISTQIDIHKEYGGVVPEIASRAHIKNITFVLRIPQSNQNLDYIINRVFRDLIPLGYSLDVKYIKDYKDFFEKDFNVTYTLNKVA